ncbi:hypothetical protein, partial [Pseudomonas umsongensis]|uniref:hypothetical protein n=1 Tax=Pseudomonas umsongensis TaxID=198618 RepID=UPI00200AF265
PYTREAHETRTDGHAWDQRRSKPMFTMKFGSTKESTSPFAEFIRNAKSEEKKRVYSEVLTEATKKQNEVMLAAQAKQA